MPRIAKRLGLVVPDYKRIREDAAAPVESELRKFRRPDRHLEVAADIIRQADAEIALHVDDRNAALASLYLHDHYEGHQLGRLAGVTKNAVREILSEAVYGDPKKMLPPRMTEEQMTQTALEHNVPHITKSPGDTLRSSGEIIEAAKARRSVAVRWMQDAVLKLSEEGRENAEIAQMAGGSRKLIWQHLQAAQRRRDRH
ncbi:hypothetical protein [Streptomyces hirsutus]|uniref:hypothetical protein n=1 Tax=Streptomyces hirsutus TaxID=35620 RepID=UPI00331FCC44